MAYTKHTVAARKAKARTSIAIVNRVVTCGSTQRTLHVTSLPTAESHHHRFKARVIIETPSRTVSLDVIEKTFFSPSISHEGKLHDL